MSLARLRAASDAPRPAGPGHRLPPMPEDHVNAPPQAVPKPPAHIWAELEAAGAANDANRLAIAHEHYVRWLEAEGYHVAHGTNRPDEAVR